MKILGLCGSLRKKSFNAKLLALAQSQFPEQVEIFESLHEIPIFNPDHETTSEAVKSLRLAVQQADAVIIASPEYVHGVPGVLKNALDWIVGTGEMDGKFVAIWNLSTTPGEPVWVRDSLKEILNVMSGGRVQTKSCFAKGAAKKKFNEDGEITDPQLISAVRQAVQQLLEIEST